MDKDVERDTPDVIKKTRRNKSSGKDTDSSSDSEYGETSGEEKEILLRPNLVSVIPSMPEVKERKKRTSKKDEKKIDKSEDLAILLVGLFDVLSSPLGEHWKISLQEAENISSPLGRILARMEQSETVSKFADPALLVLALLTTIAPRIMIGTEKPKKEVSKNDEKRPSETSARPVGDSANVSWGMGGIQSPLA